MTETYIDNRSRPAYTEIGNQFPPNLDNRNGVKFETTDIYSQIGANFMNAFFQTIMGTQHLQGNSASDIAQQAYTLAFNQSKQTQQTQQTRLTFEQWASEYMDVYETGSSDETKRKMLVYIRKHLLPFFGQMRIDEITQTDVQRFANRKSTEKCLATGRPYSHKTVKHLLDTLKKILDRAVIAGYIQKNPCIKIKNTAPPAPKRRGSTEAAQGAMIALLPQIKDERVRLWATISLSSGMRAQEIAALKWENVNWESGYFDVEEAISWYNNQPIVKSTKTEAGRRRVPFQDWAIPILKPLAQESGYILRPHRGIKDGTKPMSLSAYRHLADKFEATISQYGLPRYTAHIGRHTISNTLDKVGASNKSIEQIVGHTDADFTRAQYMNAEFEQTKRDMQKVSDFNKMLLQQSDAIYQKIASKSPV